MGNWFFFKIELEFELGVLSCFKYVKILKVNKYNL